MTHGTEGGEGKRKKVQEVGRETEQLAGKIKLVETDLKQRGWRGK